MSSISRILPLENYLENALITHDKLQKALEYRDSIKAKKYISYGCTRWVFFKRNKVRKVSRNIAGCYAIHNEHLISQRNKGAYPYIIPVLQTFEDVDCRIRKICPLYNGEGVCTRACETYNADNYIREIGSSDVDELFKSLRWLAKFEIDIDEVKKQGNMYRGCIVDYGEKHDISYPLF